MGDSRQVLADRIIFNDLLRQNSLPNLLTSDAPTMITAQDGKKQTASTAPIVQINDLAKTHGNQVNVSIIHDLSEAPSMGIDEREGHEEDISSGNFEVKIDQYHKSTKVAVMMEQQKVGYNKKKLGRPLLATYHGKLTNEICIAQLAGARGTQTATDRILPLAGAELNKIMVNPITAPTFDRMIYAGDAGSIDGTTGSAIVAGDTFGPADTRKIKQAIELSPHPIQPCSFAQTADTAGTDPMYVSFITPKMWTTFEANSTEFQKNIANALTRTKGFNHPLFQGEMFMKDNILFKKYGHSIGWEAGETIPVATDSDAATEVGQVVPAGVAVERGIVLGGQALAMAYGSVLPGGKGNFKMDGELYDMNARWRQWMDWIMGLAKIRFEDSAGKTQDYGVMAIDCSVTGV